jgi:putative SOS response-associated peptidase YedK
LRRVKSDAALAAANLRRLPLPAEPRQVKRRKLDSLRYCAYLGPMCGRFTRRKPAAEISERFDVEVDAELLAPRFNLAPTQTVVVVHQQRDTRQIIHCQWGLVPFWSKDAKLGNKLINAMAETLDVKPSFKYALEKRRCLIPADGFYEWDKRIKPAQPMFIHRRDDALFAFAGLWEECTLLDGARLVTCTIITCPPNELIGQFHHRMAAILRPEHEAAWLAPQAKPQDVLPLLQPYAADELAAYPVSTAVNRADIERPDLCEPADIGTHQPNLFG